MQVCVRGVPCGDKGFGRNGDTQLLGTSGLLTRDVRP